MNVDRIKQQVKNAIKKQPTVAVLKRKARLSDSTLGGTVIGGDITVGTYEGYLSSRGYITGVNVKDSGSKSSKRYYILFVDVPCSIGDTFTVSEKTYRIVDIDSSSGIYQDCDLEVV